MGFRSNLNSSQFYGKSLAGPYIPVEHVDLLKSIKMGGLAEDESWLGGRQQNNVEGASSIVPTARSKRSKNDFEVFMVEERNEILACSPTLLEGYDSKVFRATARELWRKADPEKKRLYREKAAVLREKENVSRGIGRSNFFGEDVMSGVCGGFGRGVTAREGSTGGYSQSNCSKEMCHSAATLPIRSGVLSRQRARRSRLALNLPKAVKSVAIKNIETKRPAGMRRSRVGKESMVCINDD